MLPIGHRSHIQADIQEIDDDLDMRYARVINLVVQNVKNKMLSRFTEHGRTLTSRQLYQSCVNLNKPLPLARFCKEIQELFLQIINEAYENLENDPVISIRLDHFNVVTEDNTAAFNFINYAAWTKNILKEICQINDLLNVQAKLIQEMQENAEVAKSSGEVKHLMEASAKPVETTSLKPVETASVDPIEINLKELVKEKSSTKQKKANSLNFNKIIPLTPLQSKTRSLIIETTTKKLINLTFMKLKASTSLFSSPATPTGIPGN